MLYIDARLRRLMSIGDIKLGEYRKDNGIAEIIPRYFLGGVTISLYQTVVSISYK